MRPGTSTLMPDSNSMILVISLEMKPPGSAASSRCPSGGSTCRDCWSSPAHRRSAPPSRRTSGGCAPDGIPGALSHEEFTLSEAEGIPSTTPQTKLYSSNISCSGPRNNNGAGSGRPLRSAPGMLRDADHDRHLRYLVAELPKLTNGVECNIFNRQLIKQARWRYGGHDVW